MADNKPTVFTADAAKRIANAVRAVEKSITPYNPQANTAKESDNSFWAKITGTGTPISGTPAIATYNWTMMIPGGGQFTERNPSITGTNAVANGEMPATNSIVRLYFVGYLSDGKPWYSFTLGKSGLFPVKLTKDGGVQGSQTTKPTYTYTIKDVESSTILTKKDGTNATGMSPTLGHQIGKFDAAEYGEAYRDSTGELVLWNAHEKEEAC
jgi:hypothetical protein